jgi:hypothetical protein
MGLKGFCQIAAEPAEKLVSGQCASTEAQLSLYGGIGYRCEFPDCGISLYGGIRSRVRFPKTQIIAFVNQKGGCGKTTSAVAISSGFATLGYSACLADTDPQCNATESFGIRADAIIEDGKFTLADAYLRKRPATDIELDFGQRFKGYLRSYPEIAV